MFKPITNQQFAEFIREQQRLDYFDGNIYDFTAGFITNLNKLYENANKEN
jgi:hypothetical protein